MFHSTAIKLNKIKLLLQNILFLVIKELKRVNSFYKKENKLLHIAAKYKHKV